MTPKRALWILIVASAFVRLFAAVNLGLGNDEAYHFLYARHPALSYYDHPPMVAWIEIAGLSLAAHLTATWALRIGFIILFGGSTWLLARLTTRIYGPWAGFLAALALNVTGYYGLAAATFALPDGPLLFFWLLTMDRLEVALRDQESSHLRPWIWVGIAWGGAMLSKYHAVLIPLGTALYLVLSAPMRRWFSRPGPYLAFGVGFLVFSPVLIWNASHGWASFLFQGGRAVGEWTLRPDNLLKEKAAQVGYLFPWIWAALVLILIRQCRAWRLALEQERLWLCLALVPLTIFTGVACFRPVLPHWGLIGLVSLFPILGHHWAVRLEERPVYMKTMVGIFAGFSVCLMALVVGEHRFGWLQRNGRGSWGIVDARTDPTLDLYGWDQVAQRIKSLGLVDDPRTFVFTSYWYQSAHLAYELGPGHPVLCYNADDPRGFAFWSRPDDWLGRDGILVVVGEIETWPRYFGRWFGSIEPVSDFQVERNGKPVRRVQLYRCHDQRRAFPFAADRGEQLARRSPDGKGVEGKK